MKSKSLIITENNIPKFNDIKETISSIIIYPNLDIEIGMLYDYCPITDYIPIPKKRGRKKKTDVPIIPEILPPGSVISVQMEKEKRGVVKIKKKKKKSKREYFLNSVVLVMIVDNNKQVNIKVSKGKFQITGCKIEKHYTDAMKYLYEILLKIEVYIGYPIHAFVPMDRSTKKDYTYNFDKLPKDHDRHKKVVDHPIMIFTTAMCNKDYSVGFNIDRNKLTKFLQEETDYLVDFDDKMDISVNVKIPNKTPYDNNLLYLELDNNETKSVVSYNEYFSLLKDKNKDSIIKTCESKFHTILVFHSGSIIQSGRGPHMADVYDKFIRLIFENKDKFKENIIIEEKMIVLHKADEKSKSRKIDKLKTTPITLKYMKSLKKLQEFIQETYYNKTNEKSKVILWKNNDGIKFIVKSNKEYHAALRDNINLYVGIK